MRFELASFFVAVYLPLLVNGLSLPTRHNNVAVRSSGNVADLLPLAGRDTETMGKKKKRRSRPIYNLNNKSCRSISQLSAPDQWTAVSGDKVVDAFQDMFDNNKLVCRKCFGKARENCTSTSEACQYGLRDLAAPAPGKAPRYDRAAAHFAANTDLNDLICSIQQGECSGAPVCTSCNGPGSWAVLKSLETMNNMMNNIYRAIVDAGSQCTDQMQQFSNVFAPIPQPKDDIFSQIMMGIVGGLVGFIPGVGGAISHVLNDVGQSVFSNVMGSNTPQPGDTASILGLITNQTAQQYIDVTDALFTDGSYTAQSADGIKVSEIRLADLMKNGTLLQQPSDENTIYSSLVGTYQKIMYQQLAVYVWNNMQNDKKGHTPYITFAPGPCGSVDDGADPFTKAGLKGINGLNVGFDYKDNCYWLLDASAESDYHAGGYESVGFSTESCAGVHALPGGDNKSFQDNSDTFAGLGLGDFVVPAVEGWLGNSKSNDYQPAAQNGALVTDPRAPGAVNIPVCDYLGSPDMPGINCPKLGGGIDKNKLCEIWPRNSVPNAPGAFAPGWCKVHVEQFQRHEGDENLLGVYQLSIGVFDDASRQVGEAIKQAAGTPLAVADSSLPFQLIVSPGALDSDPVQFWYADQFWDSNSQGNQCSVGRFDGGSRKMDCGFQCPYVHPGDDAPVSATIAHALPGAPTPAIAGPDTYINTFITATPTPTPAPDAPPPAPPAPTYATGWCGVHVRQYQIHEGDENPTGTYQVEVTLYDAKQNAIGSSGKVPAPNGQPVDVRGLVSPFTVTAGAVDGDPIKFSFNGYNGDFSQSPCKAGRYDGGHRDMDCGFTC